MQKQWRRRIPIMAASGAAVVSAVACGGGSTAERWADTYCDFLSECDPDFDSDFDSVAQCRREATDEFEDALDDLDDVRASCRNAYIALYDCVFDSVDIDACETNIADCENEAERFYDECDGEDLRGAGRVRARIAAR